MKQWDDVKAAYRRKSLIDHPDRSVSGSVCVWGEVGRGGVLHLKL